MKFMIERLLPDLPLFSILFFQLDLISFIKVMRLVLCPLSVCCEIIVFMNSDVVVVRFHQTLIIGLLVQVN